MRPVLLKRLPASPHIKNRFSFVKTTDTFKLEWQKISTGCPLSSLKGNCVVDTQPDTALLSCRCAFWPQPSNSPAAVRNRVCFKPHASRTSRTEPGISRATGHGFTQVSDLRPRRKS